MDNKNKRLAILIVLVILSSIFFVLTIIPNSPFISTNSCTDNERAEKMYASKNIAAKNKFIEKRNADCKTMLKYAKTPVTLYEKIDTCNMVDSVVDASNHYTAIHMNDKGLVKSELKYLRKNIKPYDFCPQYNDVIKALDEAQKKVQ